MWITRLINEGNTSDNICVENFKIVEQYHSAGNGDQK